MTKITLKIERHYGNKDLKIIVENLVLMKLSNFKFTCETNDKAYFNIDTHTISIHQEVNKV